MVQSSDLGIENLWFLEILDKNFFVTFCINVRNKWMFFFVAVLVMALALYSSQHKSDSMNEWGCSTCLSVSQSFVYCHFRKK